MHHRLSLAAGALIVLTLVVTPASAQTLTTLSSFNGNNGQDPQGGLTFGGNTLYGTTNSGGAESGGAVFSLPISGGTPTLLASFNLGNGSNPVGALALGDNTLYGATSLSLDGNLYGGGTLVSVPTSGGSLKVLASFSNGSGSPSPLTLSVNTLYGTTGLGGAYDDGEVFSIPVTGGSLTVLASFNGSNGSSPAGPLTLSGNILYGTTYGGGALVQSGTGTMSGNYGTVFSLPVTGGSITTLASFNNTNGHGPTAGVTLIGNTLYGTTEQGGNLSLGDGNGDGTVFSVPKSGGSVTTLAVFNGSNGQQPSGGLTLIGSNFYGTTELGGNLSLNGGLGGGTAFSLPVSGGSLTTLASFNSTTGESPQGMTHSGNTLYGATENGGLGDGTVFALNIAPATVVLANVINATIISGGTGSLGMTVSNSPSSGYNLNYTLSAAVLTGSATLGTISSGTGSLAPSTSQSCTVSATSAKIGLSTITLTAGDPNSSNLSQTTTATLTVLDHAAAAFANGNTAVTLTFGTLQVGGGTQNLQYQIENLPASYRARLDLDSVLVLSDSGGVFSTNAGPFADLAPGTMSNLFNLFLDTSQVGHFSGEYQFNLSDEQDLSGHAGAQTLTLDVTADVVPEPSTFVLLAVGALGLFGYAGRKKWSPREANPEGKNQSAATCRVMMAHKSRDSRP
jgi:uncharacterized repeat protein (TIGR03803 family)